MCGNAQDSDGGGGRHCPSPSINGNQSWRASLTHEPLEREFVERLLATSCFIGQPLPFGADKRAIRAGLIVDAKALPVVPPKVELGQIPVQMGFSHVLVDADQTALEHRKEAFKRVRMNVVPDVLAFRVIDARMLPNEPPVNDRAVRVKAAVPVKMQPQRRANRVVVEEHRADVTAAFNEAQNLPVSALARRAARLGRLADKGFVGFDDLARAAYRAGAAAAVHRKSNAVHQEPSGFHAAAKGALYLPGAYALLAAANQVDRLKPYAHRNVRRLENRPHTHREGLAASAAIPQTGPRRLAFGARRFGNRAAMRADRAVRPKPRFDIGESGIFIGEVRGVESGFHGEPLSRPPFYRVSVLCQV